MFEAYPSLSNAMSFTEVIERLVSSGKVAGIALFGSSAANLPRGASDYDLLLLIPNNDIHIFQMHTWIDGISADVVFVEIALAERVLALSEPVSGNSPESFVMSWLQSAKILYEKEASGRLLARMQSKIREREWRVFDITSKEAYEEWFWLNFDLRHIQRLGRSTESIQLMTADIRLMACISQLCRTYFKLRGLAWKGEKAALRYLQEYDHAYFNLLEAYFQQPDRVQKINLCEQLISLTLKPIGKLWSPASTAIYLQSPSKHPEDVDKSLSFWNSLLQI